MLEASDQTKARICRDIRNTVFPVKYFCYTDEQKQRFLSLCDAKDFEGAIAYFHDTMLPYLKKASPIWYESQLIEIRVEQMTIVEYTTQLKKYCDEAVAESSVKWLLLGFKKLHNKKQLYAGDLLYLLQEVSKLPVTEDVKAQKYCIYHLLVQLLRNRTTGKIIERSVKDALFYLQEKYHCFDENDPKDIAMYKMEFRKDTFKEEWDKYQNPEGKQPRSKTTLDDLRRMLDEMDQRHAEEVHHLFMDNYMDYSDYEFRDEWMIDGYHECFHEYFRSGGEYIDQLNGYVIEILREWQQDANYKYQKAKKDLIWWMEDPIPEFKPSLSQEIDIAVNEAGDTEDDEVMVRSLMPFPLKIADIVKSGNYEDAAANLYCLFDYLAALEKKHKQWFESLWTGGMMSKMACFFDTISELYCHLRQLEEVPNTLKDEMDIHLLIFNRKTYFFGDMWGVSRFEDMLLDGKKQFNDYSVLEECPMWNHWYLKNYSERPNTNLIN